MKIKNPFALLTRFEFFLWIFSVLTVSLSMIFSPNPDPLSIVASLIGVTALIFIAKGMVFGQVLIIIFAILYGIVSISFSYWGEMITYLFMSAPAALIALIAWLKNPYENTSEVRVRTHLSRTALITIIAATVAVSAIFYVVLCALDTANLIFSTVSVATSFFAASLTYLRIPYYALAYAANDIVLIVLWALASAADASYVPMILCFATFLVNDIYGFISWRRMEKRQAK